MELPQMKMRRKLRRSTSTADGPILTRFLKNSATNVRRTCPRSLSGTSAPRLNVRQRRPTRNDGEEKVLLAEMVMIYV